MRAGPTSWDRARFELADEALTIHRPGHAQEHLHFDLARIRTVEPSGTTQDDAVIAEVTTTNGAVLTVHWPGSFLDTVLAALGSRRRPPAPMPVPDALVSGDVEFTGRPHVGAADLSALSAASRRSAAPAPSHRAIRRAARRLHGRRHHPARWALGVAAVVLALLAVDGGALHRRVERFSVDLPEARDSVRTWLLVGSDSREAAAGLPRPETFGSVDDVPGERADVVLLVQEGGHEMPPRIVSVPRDLLVFRDGRGVDRLALTLLDGPTGVVTSICRSLGVPVDHMVTIRFDGLRDLVDAVGGVEVRTGAATRDVHTGLDLPGGTSELDGAGAIAWMRSRHLDVLVGDRWERDPSSDTGRQERQREVLDELSARMASGSRHPIGAHRFAWVATGAISVDDGTSPIDLLRLAATLRNAASADSLPHSLVDGEIPVATLDPAAQEVLDGLRSGLDDGPPCPRPDLTR